MRRPPSKLVRNRKLVLGLGNPLAGDDSFGPKIIEKLRSAPPEGVDLGDASTDLLSWIEEFPAYDLVVIVDALLTPEAAAGQVVVLSEEQLAGYPDSSPSVHQMSPLLGLRLFRKLHPEAGTRILLVALQTHSIRVGVPLEERTLEEGRASILSLVAAVP